MAQQLKKLSFNAEVMTAIEVQQAIEDAVVRPDGTAAHPFEISSAADLEQLRQEVAAGDCKEGKHFLQTADIDMSGVGWVGIGLKEGDDPDAEHTFMGVYDGGNHTIYNLTFSCSTEEGADNELYGFFRSVVGATIKNLTINLRGFTNLPANGKFGGAVFVGTVKDGVTMLNCTANGNVGSAANPCGHTAAGVIAYVTTPTAGTAHGAKIVNLTNVTNNANLYTSRKAGGIIGFILHDLTMVNVVNSGMIFKVANPGKEDGVGGLVGWGNGGTHTVYILDNVANVGAVEVNLAAEHAQTRAGQLVGRWGIESGGSSNLGDVKVVFNPKALPISTSTNNGGFGLSLLDLWFGEVRSDGFCHAVRTLENGGEYVYMFKNDDANPPAYTLPAGYTVKIDHCFGIPNIVDANGAAITGTLDNGTKYTYTAPAAQEQE